MNLKEIVIIKNHYEWLYLNKMDVKWTIFIRTTSNEKVHNQTIIHVKRQIQDITKNYMIEYPNLPCYIIDNTKGGKRTNIKIRNK